MIEQTSETQESIPLTAARKPAAVDRLVWIDLEMTGLLPQQDVILEIATIITNAQLEVLAEGPSLVIHQSDATLNAMCDWCKQTHAANGLIENVKASRISEQEAEEKTIEFLSQWILPNTAPFCGNSVWQDKRFLEVHMPELLSWCHYRIVDVSSVKALVRGWYPKIPAYPRAERTQHRALDDVRASIQELSYYRDRFFIPSASEIST